MSWCANPDVTLISDGEIKPREMVGRLAPLLLLLVASSHAALLAASFAPTRCVSPQLLAKKSTWSVGHSRKQGVKKQKTTAAAARAGGTARGFGAAPAAAAADDLLGAQVLTQEETDVPHEDPEEAMKAWREYAARAMAHAEEMEAKAGGAEQHEFLSQLEAE